MQQRLHKYRRDPERLPTRQITERSVEIIGIIERYKFLPTSVITAVAGGNERITKRHLQALYHKGFLNRFTFPRVGNPGEFIYYIDDIRSLTLLVNHGATHDALDWEGTKRNKEKKYSEINLGHRIDDMQGRLMHLHHEVMISRFHAMLELACRQSKGKVQLADWRQGSQLWNRVEVAKLYYDEKGNWRELDQTEMLPHRPDAFFTLHFSHEPEGRQNAHFFYEADRKHTSIKKHNRKLRAHFHYIVKQRRHEQDYGIKRVRAVLIETIDDYWADDLRKAAAHPVVSGNKPSPLFWFTTSRLLTEKEEIKKGNQTRAVPRYLINPSIIFKKIWAAPVDDTLYSLLD
ncbi:MAG: replication-relaxation family protein [Acidobacteriota bacterium]|nr:replication-relaxation family protein [Acidobacteriota bacterium]